MRGRRGSALSGRRAGAREGSREPVPALAVSSEEVGGFLEATESTGDGGRGRGRAPHWWRQREQPALGSPRRRGAAGAPRAAQ